MPFKFIDNTIIDRQARKLIRSHAAKGKNLGRKLSRPSRQKIPPCRPKIIEIVRNQEQNPIAGNSRATGPGLISYPGNEISVPIEYRIGDELSLVLFPFEATPKARSLVHRVLSFVASPCYPLEVCTTIDFTAKTSNFMAEKIFRDEACFYCTAAMSLVAFNSRSQDQEAFHLLAFAFRLLNRKLSGGDALEDPTIAAVVTMTHYERLRGEYRKGLVHLRGIQRMVEMRGGISQLTKTRPGLTQKIFRADLELALYIGSATVFQADDAPGHDTITWLRNKFMEMHNPQFIDSELFRVLDPRLQEVLIDISSLAWMLNGHLGYEHQLAGYGFHDVLLLFGYRLLQISPLCGPRSASWLENTIHASLMVFISSFLTGLGGILPAFPPLSRLARSVAQNYPGEGIPEQEVFLWTLLAGSISIFSKEDDAWLLPRMQKTALALDLHDWEDVSRILCKFPWVKAFHDKPAQALWDRSKSLYPWVDAVVAT